MVKGLKMGREKAALVVLASILVIVGIILACAGPRTRAPYPSSKWGDKYFYSYEPPEIKPVGSVKVTVAVVSPNYTLLETTNPMYKKIAKGLAKSLETDIDKIIVAKGMTVTGPFERLDLMTYPDKKNVDLTLTPAIEIKVETIEPNEWALIKENLWATKNIKVKAEVKVLLFMLEPLSGEKVWVKSIDLGETEKNAQLIAEALWEKRAGKWAHYVGAVGYDERPEALAEIIKEKYPEIMKTIWKYLNPEEMRVLKEKAEEVRKLKRY